MASLVGQEVAGRYRILEPLGQGGMAIVYKAHDARLDRQVAIKFIRSGSLNKQNAEKLRRRFEREAKALAKFSHPSIVKVYDYGEFQGDPFLVMEYLPGGTLKSRAGKPIPYAEAAAILAPVGRALAYAHQREVIHRDVKPGNILFSETNEGILTDFGIAKILEAEDGTALTGTGVGIGTPEYMAPEQATGQVVDTRVDVYALGIVLYELVTGRKPFTGDTPVAVLLKHVQEPIPSARQFIPDLPEEFMHVLNKALAKNPNERYADMAAFAEDLQRLASGVTQKYSAVPAENNTAEMPQSLVTKSPSSPSLPAVARIRTDSHPAIPIAAPTRPQSKRKWLVPLIIVIGILIVGVFGMVLLTGILLLSPTNNTNGSGSQLMTPLAGRVYPEAGATLIYPKDDSVMVFIPDGEFKLGSLPDDPDSSVDEYPQHPVYLSAYWIDRTEVTNAAFQKFVEASGYKTDAEKAGTSRLYQEKNQDWELTQGVDWRHPQGLESNITGLEKLPVVHVSWNDAKAYCEWAGKRLPSEAEWEKAARGTDLRKYAWGNQPPAGNLANFADQNIPLDEADKTINDGQKFSASVGSYPDGASPYGLLDVAGNVWEWVMDTYDKDYYLNAPYANPINTSDGTTRVLRGGSWANRLPVLAQRSWSVPAYSDDNNGFRCALSAIFKLEDKVSQVQATSTAIAVYTFAKSYQTNMQQQAQATQDTISNCMKDVPTFSPLAYRTRTCDDYSTNFNGWFSSIDSNDWQTTSHEFKEGKYIWDTKTEKSFVHRATLGTYIVDDFEAGLAAKLSAGEPDKICYGIVFRKYINEFYFYEVCENKQFSVLLMHNGEWTSLVEKTDTDAILPGKVNWLSVIGNGNQFDFYVNKQKVTSVTDDTLTVGVVGIGIDVDEKQSATFEFDKFFLRTP